MGNIIRIIAADWKRLASNVVAVVVVIGLSVLPCMYAWFNILSNWDPYGEAATSNLQVAVVSCDEGVIVVGKNLNVGDKVIENLKTNKSIGWVFMDTEIEAINAVTAGDVYACLVIEEEFTNNLVSFLGGDLTHPVIDYYENEKINAIAPKITGKVKTTVQQSVNQAFVGTLTEVLASASESVITANEDGELINISANKLDSLRSDLNAYVLIVDSYLALMDSTENVMEAAEAVTDEMDSLLVSARSMANSADSAADAAIVATNGMLAAAGSAVDTAASSIQGMEDTVKYLTDKLQNLESIGAPAAKSIRETTDKEALDFNSTYYNMYDSNGDGIVDSYYYVNDVSQRNTNNVEIKEGEQPIELRALNPAVWDNLASDKYYLIDNVSNDYAKVCEDAILLEDSVTAVSDDVSVIIKEMEQDLAICEEDIATLSQGLNNTVAPQVKTTLSSVQSSITEIQRILNFNSSSVTAVSKALNSYPDIVNVGRESLEKSREDAISMMDMLTNLIDDINGLSENEKYTKLIEIIQKDPDYLADFVSSPVKIQQEPLYPIDTNGSASAPFYIVLSIWVGSLILSTILKTPVKDKTGLRKVKNWQCFFGRYATTFVIAQVQTLITVLGALLYIGIQCEHPFMLWLCCSWTAAVYSLLLYSFSYSFGNVGEALSVILMVVQVAGSGGTFPIEVLPKPFQVLYGYMPFAYSMNAARECIAGFYKYDYWKYCGALLAYVAVAIFIGLVLYFPMKRLNHKIEASKESSGILI
ncbi:MAG: YhgE/Pip domain-containing protein [Pseudobutyrivibrio sp.]|nr:YhgE/Pip domain-containing protein [Pseudobutyrivibrio sp.]